MNMKKLTLISAAILTAAFTVSSQAQTTIVDDVYANDGTDIANLDADYFGSSGSSATEFNVDNIGLRSGSSGRQLHALFPTQTLNLPGDTLTLSVAFTTPPTVASGNEDFRFAVFDNLGRTGNTGPDQLGQDTSYSSNNPSLAWTDLPGVFAEIDIDIPDPDRMTVDDDTGILGPDPLETNLAIRVANPTDSGRGISTTSGFGSSNDSDSLGYIIEPNTDYTMTFEIELLEDDQLSTTVTFGGASLDVDGDGAGIVPAGDLTHTAIGDIPPLTTSFGMFAIGSSSGAVGSNNSEFSGTGIDDNGINLTSFSVIFTPAGSTTPTAPTEDETCHTIPALNGNTSVVCL